MSTTTTEPRNFVKGGDTKLYRYPHEPAMVHEAGSNRAWNNHFLKELSTHNCSESNCKHPIVSRIAAGLARIKAPENPHMFRSSVNLDEFDSLQGSSDPSNATGTTSSVIMRANLRQNNCSIHGRVCLVRAPVASHNWQYPPPLVFWFIRIPVELCASTFHKVFWCSSRHSNSLASKTR